MKVANTTKRRNTAIEESTSASSDTSVQNNKTQHPPPPTPQNNIKVILNKNQNKNKPKTKNTHTHTHAHTHTHLLQNQETLPTPQNHEPSKTSKNRKPEHHTRQHRQASSSPTSKYASCSLDATPRTGKKQKAAQRTTKSRRGQGIIVPRGLKTNKHQEHQEQQSTCKNVAKQHISHRHRSQATCLRSPEASRITRAAKGVQARIQHHVAPLPPFTRTPKPEQNAHQDTT